MLLLLFCLLWTNVSYVYAEELNDHSREQILHSPQIQSQLQELRMFLYSEQIDALNFSLQRIALPGQEAVRYLLLKRIEQEQVAVSFKMKQFVQAQLSIKPVYYVSEKSDGYIFTVPAFDFPSVSNRLLRIWKHDQSIIEMVLSIEQQKFDLQSWLSGDESLISLHESLLIQELDGLSEDAVRYLTHQLIHESVTSWLPSTRLMSALARKSHDADLYRLLWLMRSDTYSVAELHRLSALTDSFSVGQIIAAAHNPRLRQPAIKILTGLRPMPDNVKHFLILQMSRSETAEVTARALIKEGYSHWLQDLMQGNNKIKRRIIQRFIGL
ncbi:hypothetical protein [Vibrio quintilis]|uniref:Uncharacterized protein n=1 Tax=Vibrio quintilis TaxID=1117707 RepID=A0A1M7YZN6_9VIBR|nr:hypothetical protein [Vibrio quintilis]SHO58033.1 hypothetical protein VQ7734_03803 [Vibrio quintilis]